MDYLHCNDFLNAYNPLTQSFDFFTPCDIPSPTENRTYRKKSDFGAKILRDLYRNLKEEVCEHQVFKRRCGLCRDRYVCRHRYLRAGCKKCSPENWCLHNKFIWSCKNCVAAAKNDINEERAKVKCTHYARPSRCIVCSPHLFCGHLVKKKTKPFRYGPNFKKDCVTKKLKCLKCAYRVPFLPKIKSK